MDRIAVQMDTPQANRVLLALARLDQERGIDPALAELAAQIQTALVKKSSGDTDSAPSTE